VDGNIGNLSLAVTSDINYAIQGAQAKMAIFLTDSSEIIFDPTKIICFGKGIF